MILWSFKQILKVRKALAGRDCPHQMAWGVAFGLLLGLIPHGNLVAIGLIVLVICLNLNHAVAAVTGVAVSFFAARLDPYTHQIGQYVLLNPDWSDHLAIAWQLPLAPWTDLNNTVVLGSLVLGLAFLLPAYAVSYPAFRLLAAWQRGRQQTVEAPATDQQPDSQDPQPTSDADRPGSQPTASAQTAGLRIDSGHDQQEVIQTQIDVIRLKDYRQDQPENSSVSGDTDTEQINEALNYLLGRLQEKRQESAA